MTRPRLMSFAAIGIALLAVLAVAGPAAAAPATAWQVKQGVDPTILPPGTTNIVQYHLRVTNVGAEEAASGVTVTDTVSAGATPVVEGPRTPAGAPLAQFPVSGAKKTNFPCTIAGQTVTCEVEGRTVLPGEEFDVFVPVAIAADPPAEVTNEVVVSSPGVSPIATVMSSRTGNGSPAFAFSEGPLGLSGSAFDESGATPAAGAHPFDVELSAHVTTLIGASGMRASDPLRSLHLEMPAGLVANPLAVKERCTLAALQEAVAETPVVACPPASQVGTVHFNILRGLEGLTVPLIDMVPPPGVPAEFAFVVNGTITHIRGGLAGNFHLTAGSEEVTAKFPIPGIKVDLWGIPSDFRHDSQRAGTGLENRCVVERGCSVEPSPVPFLTMPTSCTEAMTLGGTATGWLGSATAGSALFEEGEGGSVTPNGCNRLGFEPTIASQATTNRAESPSGLEFGLHQPQPAVDISAGTVAECSRGSWHDPDLSTEVSGYAFAWLRDGTPIPGASSRTYELQAEDSGVPIQCEVAATVIASAPLHPALTTRGVSPARVIGSSPAVAPPKPGDPTIEVVGEEAVCAAGTWSEGTNLSYAWFENGILLSSQTGESYTPLASPVTLQCEVTGTNAGGSVVAFSPPQSLPTSPATRFPDATAPPQIGVSASALPLAAAALKDVQVTLPEGVTLNPSAANGLGACSEGEMGYAPEEGKIRFGTAPQTCPQAAKIGTVEVRTPLLEDPLPGAVYVAKPFDNPFGSLLAIYLAVEDQETGIVAKLAGKVEPDPATGRLTSVFTESPQLPIEDIDLHLFNGSAGVLTTPLTCGAKTTETTLTPWSTPEGEDAHPSDSFQTTAGCYGSEAEAPKTISFSAGTESPLAGAFSPFVLRLARPDGSQHITGVETTLPEGLTGKLAGIPYCPEEAIALAKSREAPEKGAEEQASPSCPAASEVGTVQVTAGSGITPIPVSGHAYMAGPYKGAPLSLVVIVPAVAGPFDLGDVVSRVALHVGEYDARIHAVSDPLPTIIDGIPLDVRSVELKLDRPGFTLNPTSCEAASITGAVTTQAGQSAPLSNRFQVGECGRLGFKPKLSLSLKGKTTRSGHPALRAVVKLPKGGANVASAQVGLPHSEFLDQGNIGRVCTQADLKAATCPKGTVYGHVKAWTPLFEKPLEGPVYLGVGFGYQLPALVAELNGQVRVLLVGKTDTTKKHGLRNTFETVPDAPAEKLVLELKGGPKYGLLVNSENICRRKQKASATFTAANGKVTHLTPTIANSCKKAKHHGHKKHKQKKKKKKRGGR